MKVRSKVRLTLTAGTALALGCAWLPAASAQVQRDSGWSRYLEWTYNGTHHCAGTKSEIDDAGQFVYGVSWVRYRSGGDCHADAVPAGWLAVRGYIVDENGMGCAFMNGWSPNTYSTDTHEDEVVPSAGQCPSGHSYYMRSKGEVYRPNYGGFASSDWLASPWIVF